jgi:hypothetical protein
VGTWFCLNSNEPWGPAQERLHLLVDLLTDATHLGLGDAALGAELRHQHIDLAGRDPPDVGLHDHRVQGLINPAARLEDRGEEAARAQFRDLQCQIPHLGGEGARSVAVAVAETLFRALVPDRTEEGAASSSSIGCCRPWRASSGISSPALLPSSSGAREDASNCCLGMVRLVEVVLEPGKRACPPLATSAVEPIA